MSHGNSLIINKSKLKREFRDVFLTAKYFREKPHISAGLEAFTNWFDPTTPTNEIEETIIKFLDDESVDYTDKLIEYWFQHQVEGQYLSAHCDYNHKVRNTIEDCGEWLHTVESEKIMSPITIGCYLEVNDLDGGEFGISSFTWHQVKRPLFLDEETYQQIHKANVELYNPKQDDVIYFEGSKHYHWIETVKKGERKSMMINFWPARYALS